MSRSDRSGTAKSRGAGSSQLHDPLLHVHVIAPEKQLSVVEHAPPCATFDGQSAASSPQPAKLPAPMASTDASSIRVIIRMQRR